MSDDQLPPQLIRYGPPYGPEKLPELTAEEIEAISPPSLYLTALKRIVQLEERHAALVEAAVRCLRTSHVGDQNFIASLKTEECSDLRDALIDLNDYLRENE